MSTRAARPRGVIDDDLVAAWERLAAELEGDAAAIHRYVSTYVERLQGRLDTLSRALEDDDLETAETVALTVHSTSAIAGCSRLAELALALAQQLGDGDGEGARRALPQLAETGSATARHVRKELSRWDRIDGLTEPHS